MLTHRIAIQGTTCLDLFAGTGAFGFEALSRGADACHFVDISLESARVIEKTAASLACETQIKFFKSDAIDFLTQHHPPYEIIFADPPYNFKHYEELIARALAKEPLIFVLEHSKQAGHFGSYGIEHISRSVGKTSLEIYLLFR